MNSFRTILHPTDFSRHAEVALDVARSLARDLGARLIIVHVAPEEGLAHGMMAVPADPRMYLDLLEGARRRVAGPDLKFQVETQLWQGNVAEEILRAASESGCDLIVMGSHGRSGLGRLLLGGVAEAVMHKADCPVLTVKSARSGIAPAGHRSETANI
ncbi:MAG: universal stress protein [Planctomycetaceae bacterium]|nr:universal stress protein [Planctomycetaceae bacterium]MBV8558446.1 universal stress protein [Planctomycetaceae bacterium]MBV8610214.1 universal stress protein [Singulisphaera sp.]